MGIGRPLDVDKSHKASREKLEDGFLYMRSMLESVGYAKQNETAFSLRRIAGSADQMRYWPYVWPGSRKERQVGAESAKEFLFLELFASFALVHRSAPEHGGVEPLRPLRETSKRIP